MYKFYAIDNLFPVVFTFIVSILFFVFTISMAIQTIKDRTPVIRYFLIYIFDVVLCIVSTYVLLSTSLGIFFQITDYVVPYKEGNYQVVSGEVTNYKKYLDNPRAYVTFTVDDVEFEYNPSMALYIGINRPNCINAGDEVVIKYVVADDIESDNEGKINVMMEIENKNASNNFWIHERGLSNMKKSLPIVLLLLIMGSIATVSIINYNKKILDGDLMLYYDAWGADSSCYYNFETNSVNPVEIEGYDWAYEYIPMDEGYVCVAGYDGDNPEKSIEKSYIIINTANVKEKIELGDYVPYDLFYCDEFVLYSEISDTAEGFGRDFDVYKYDFTAKKTFKIQEHVYDVILVGNEIVYAKDGFVYNAHNEKLCSGERLFKYDDSSFVADNKILYDLKTSQEKPFKNRMVFIGTVGDYQVFVNSKDYFTYTDCIPYSLKDVRLAKLKYYLVKDDKNYHIKNLDEEILYIP